MNKSDDSTFYYINPYLKFCFRWNTNGHHSVVVALGNPFQVIICDVSVVLVFRSSSLDLLVKSQDLLLRRVKCFIYFSSNKLDNAKRKMRNF